MAHKFFDRVRETTTSTGTGNITLAGAATGYRTFGSVLSNNETCPYAIAHQTAAEWEVGYGTWQTGGTLVRDTVLSSSNSGSAVNFASGTKDIWIDSPADFFQSRAIRCYAATTANCSNTATEIDVISTTILANTWEDGERVVIQAPTEWRNLDGGSPTLTIKFYYGSDSYTVQSQTIGGSGLTRTRYEIEAWRVGSDLWVLGWDYSYGYAVPHHFAALNAAIGGDQFSSGKNGAIISSPGFSSNKTLKITAKWSTASTNRYYTVKGAKIWKM